MLVTSRFCKGILEPSPEKDVLVPDIILVPLLSFNEDCHRLGYGGGFYDRTISYIKYVLKREILTIGLAFEVMKFQQEDGVPEFEVNSND